MPDLTIKIYEDGIEITDKTFKVEICDTTTSFVYDDREYVIAETEGEFISHNQNTDINFDNTEDRADYEEITTDKLKSIIADWFF